MTLVEICEPLFQYVCRLNRMGRKGGRPDAGAIRADINQIFAEMRAKADAAPNLSPAYQRVELPLCFFVDSMILNGPLEIPGGWKAISHERREMAFEAKFWDLLEEQLRDPSDPATQALGVYYVCIGLGFQGQHMGEPDVIRRKMLEISSRLRGSIDADAAARICPDAYEQADTRNLTRPPGRSLMGLVIGVVVMAVVLIVAYVQLFRSTSEDLRGSLDDIGQSVTRAAESAGE